MKHSIALLFCFAPVTLAQTPTQVDWLTQVKNKNAFPVTQNTIGTNGGYMVFSAVNYNPYDSSVPCYDKWGNPVQQPLPANQQAAFGLTDVLLWNSLSPSMQFQSGTGTGLVQPVLVTSPATTNTGPCGIPLPVQTDYGLNSNGYFFGRGGLATDNPLYNSVQSLQGGMVANSYTAGVLYPAGTVVCTAMSGSTCTNTSTLGVATYLGGHTDVGHSNGPPQGTTIVGSVNPFSSGEGLVAGMLYYDDGLHCLNVYSGAAWACVGSGGGGTPGSPTNSVQFNSSGSFGGSSNFTWNNSTEILSISGSTTSGVQAPAFSSTNTGGNIAFTNGAGNFTILANGTANFQSLALTNGLTVDSGTYGVSGTGALTVASCSGCGGSGSPGSPTSSVQFNQSGAFAGNAAFEWNNSTGNLTVCTSIGGICTSSSGVNAQVFSSAATGTATAYTDAGANFTILGNGTANFQSLALTNGLTVDSGSYGLSGTGVLTVLSCTGCGGASPGLPVNSVQFNNPTGTFAGNSNFTFNSTTGVLAVCTSLGGICTSTSGVDAQVFSSAATGTAAAYTDVGANFSILGNGTGNFATLNVGSGSPLTINSSGNLTTTGFVLANAVTTGGGSYGINNSGAIDGTSLSLGSYGITSGGAATLASVSMTGSGFTNALGANGDTLTDGSGNTTTINTHGVYVTNGTATSSITYTGIVSGVQFYANLTAGVTCSGTPTSSFATIGGIVTHC